MASDPDLYQAHHFHQWNEEDGTVLWWLLPVTEPPYVGTPLDLGQTVVVEIRVGGKEKQTARCDVGGWPFEEADVDNLMWTRLPGAIRWSST